MKTTQSNIVSAAIDGLDPPTQAELARVCDQHPQAVTRWLRTGRIPHLHCAAIERASGVHCERLRPDVMWTRDTNGQVTGYHVPLPSAA